MLDFNFENLNSNWYKTASWRCALPSEIYEADDWTLQDSQHQLKFVGLVGMQLVPREYPQDGILDTEG
jgi:hypothetical protein